MEQAPRLPNQTLLKEIAADVNEVMQQICLSRKMLDTLIEQLARSPRLGTEPGPAGFHPGPQLPSGSAQPTRTCAPPRVREAVNDDSGSEAVVPASPFGHRCACTGQVKERANHYTSPACTWGSSA